MKRLATLALTLMACAPASAQHDANEAMKKCAAIDGTVERLACFDDASKAAGVAPTTTAVAGKSPGSWRSVMQTNPLDDSKVIVILLDSTTADKKRKDQPSLVIRCSSNKTDLYINWEDFLGSESIVTSRIDKQKPVVQEWKLSTDKTSSFSASPVKLAKQLVEAKTFVAQTTPYSESPVTAIFDLEGIGEAIKPLREECRW